METSTKALVVCHAFLEVTSFSDEIKTVRSPGPREQSLRLAQTGSMNERTSM